MELKPCPFCGCIDIRVRKPSMYSFNEFWYVWCFNCGVRTDDCDEDKKAIAIWNIRPLTDAEKLEAILGSGEVCLWFKGTGEGTKHIDFEGAIANNKNISAAIDAAYKAVAEKEKS